REGCPVVWPLALSRSPAALFHGCADRGPAAPSGPASRRPGSCSRGRERRRTGPSAAVPLRDQDAEHDLEPAESAGEESRSPGRRTEEGDRSEEHESDTHDGDDAHREGAARHHRRTVEKKPDPREELGPSGALEGEGDQGASGERGRQGEKESSGRTGEEWDSETASLRGDGPGPDPDGQEGFGHPDPE